MFLFTSTCARDENITLHLYMCPCFCLLPSYTGTRGKNIILHLYMYTCFWLLASYTGARGKNICTCLHLYVYTYFAHVCTFRYTHVWVLKVSNYIEKHREPFAVSQRLSKLESTWMMGRRQVTFLIQIIFGTYLRNKIREQKSN